MLATKTILYARIICRDDSADECAFDVDVGVFIFESEEVGDEEPLLLLEFDIVSGLAGVDV